VELYPTPPDVIAEAVPPAPDENSTYQPGGWVYRQDRFFWRPGYWVEYRPGWVWVPAGYFRSPRGYAFVDGYWDYELQNRGMAFAPVYFTQEYHRHPQPYRPAYAISPEFMLGSLFVNNGWNHYYFGDYYDSAYQKRGYLPWVNYRYGQNFRDPLFNYYRWRHHDDPRWETNLRSVYTQRSEDRQIRPARTLIQQVQRGTNRNNPSF